MRTWTDEDLSEKQTDYATFLRIPLLKSAQPMWSYITGIVVDHWATLTPEHEGYAMVPTDAELDQVAEMLHDYNTYYNAGYLQKMREFAPYDIDGGANCGYFRKRGENDWVYRKKTWEYGPAWMPLPENPEPLDVVLERAHKPWAHMWTRAAAAAK